MASTATSMRNCLGGGKQTPYTFILKLALTFDGIDPPFYSLFERNFLIQKKKILDLRSQEQSNLFFSPT